MAQYGGIFFSIPSTTDVSNIFYPKFKTQRPTHFSFPADIGKVVILAIHIAVKSADCVRFE
jgi:hypothetical protein